MTSATPPTVIDATSRLKAFRRLMQLAGKFYHANPLNPPRNMDLGSEDVQNLMRSFNRNGVRYLVVGGFAGLMHGHNRTTHDLDVWVERGDENRQRLVKALREANVAGAEFLKTNPMLFGWSSLQFGEGSFELDLGEELHAFGASDFNHCFQRAVETEFDGVPFRVLQLNDLIHEKRSTGRAKDLGDVEELEKIAQRRAE